VCCVYFTVLGGVFELQVSLLHKGRDLLELVVGIGRVVHDDSVEDLGEMSVEVLLDIATSCLGFTKLGLDAIKSFTVNAHNFFV